MHKPGKCLLLLVFLLVIFIYPRAKAMTSLATPGWTGLSIIQQCSYAHHQTSSPWLWPTYILCVLFTAVYRFCELALALFDIAIFDIAIFETMGLLPPMPVAGTPSSQTKISNEKRDSSASYFEGIRRQDREVCVSDNTKVSDCINKTTGRDVTYVIVAGVLIGISCVIFGALMIYHLNRDNKKAKKTVLLKKEKKTSSSGANQVGLGRGLGSDGVGKDRGLRTVSLGEQERDLGTEGTADGLATSTWNENALKRYPSSWIHLFRAGQYVRTCFNPLPLSFFYRFTSPSYIASLLFIPTPVLMSTQKTNSP